MRSKA